MKGRQQIFTVLIIESHLQDGCIQKISHRWISFQNFGQSYWLTELFGQKIRQYMKICYARVSQRAQNYSHEIVIAKQLRSQFPNTLVVPVQEVAALPNRLLETTQTKQLFYAKIYLLTEWGLNNLPNIKHWKIFICSVIIFTGLIETMVDWAFREVKVKICTSICCFSWRSLPVLLLLR